VIVPFAALWGGLCLWLARRQARMAGPVPQAPDPR
jgi:AAA family ATP:ADP antiporter